MKYIYNKAITHCEYSLSVLQDLQKALFLYNYNTINIIKIKIGC